jgi:hypothetical protein
MRRTLLLAVAIVCISGSVVCAYLARPQLPATLEAVNPVFDVGEVGQGETRSVEFELINHFPRNVEIKEVFKSCSCTNVVLAKRTLAPGETVALKGDWQTGASRGKRAVDLTLTFAPEGQLTDRLRLRVEGNVVPDMQYSPEKLEFEKGKPATKIVVFKAGRMANGELKKASCTHHAFTAALGPESNEVTVTYDPTKWTVDDEGTSFGSIGLLQVETNSPHEEVCHLPLIVREQKTEN